MSHPGRRKNPLAELLTRIAFERGTPGAEEPLAIAYRHRGAPGDVREVSGTAIAAVSRRGLELEDGTTVPLHRLLEVRRGTAVLWARGKPVS